MDEKDLEVIKTLLRLLFNAQLEIAVLNAVLLGAGIPPQKFANARQQSEERFARILAQLDELPASAMLEFLRRFDGPIQ